MAYIRVKKINNKPYAYLVENKKTANGPRQKVLQYLGRVHHFEPQKENALQEIRVQNKKEFIRQLASSTLEAHGFKRNQKNLVQEKITFSPQQLTLIKNNKEAILAVNEGKLCSFTLQRLANFKKTRDLNKDANLLARYFLEAGLPVSQEQFVSFYQLF